MHRYIHRLFISSAEFLKNIYLSCYRYTLGLTKKYVRFEIKKRFLRAERSLFAFSRFLGIDLTLKFLDFSMLLYDDFSVQFYHFLEAEDLDVFLHTTANQIFFWWVDVEPRGGLVIAF